MNNWAIVIGVDYYPANEAWTLQGAVRDALAMRDWLLNPNGGNVAFQNLRLLLSPCPDAPAPSLKFIEATQTKIEDAINDLLTQSRSCGDRVFLYFSGHGLSVDINLTVEQGILASDFSLKTSTRSMTVKSLFDLFQGTNFKQQYFIIDACRNIPVDRIRLGQFPYIPPPVIPSLPQFVMFATQPCVKAMQVGYPGNESGAFTSALLNGLKGKGSAKSWDNNAGEYVVRWNELFSAVFKEVKSRKLEVNFGEPLIQEPRQYGERGDENPELGRFPDASIPDEVLQIDLEPNPTVLPIACIKINTFSGTAHVEGPPISKLPIVVKLRPRIYGINGSAAGFKPIIAKEVRLYNQARVKLEFEANPPGPPPTGPIPLGEPAIPSSNVIPPASPIPLGEPAILPLNATPPDVYTFVPHQRSEPPLLTSAVPFNKTLRGGLQVLACESLALLQVANEAGTILKTARGQITLNDLPLGFYSLRMISPEGIVVSEVIESPKLDGMRIVELFTDSAKSPAMDFLAEFAELKRAADGSISPSESIGPTFFLKLSTTLALAAAAQLEDDSGFGHKLRMVPLSTFHELTSDDAVNGLHLVFGDELNAGFWNSATVFDIVAESEREMYFEGLLGRNGYPIRPYAIYRHIKRDENSIRSFAIDCQTGSRTVRIKWNGHVTDIPCFVLPGRVTLIVITRELDGSIEVHQYMPLTRLAESLDYGYPILNARDPQYRTSNFSAIRRIEYMQRAMAHGRISPLKPDVELLLKNKWNDPIAGCLGSYLALRMGMIDDLESATENLVRHFGELPDSHVLRGMFLLKMNLINEASNQFRQAFNIGPPIFREGVSLLEGLDKSLYLTQELKMHIAEMSAGLASGQLWCIKSTKENWYDSASLKSGALTTIKELELKPLPLLNKPHELDS